MPDLAPEVLRATIALRVEIEERAGEDCKQGGMFSSGVMCCSVCDGANASRQLVAIDQSDRINRSEDRAVMG